MSFWLLALSLLLSKIVLANNRNVTLNWEPIAGAVFYELEVGNQMSASPLQTFPFLSEAKWVGPLSPGFYWMRVRARDDRNNPGAWSEKIEFRIKLPAPQLFLPVREAVFPTKNEQSEVSFQWEPIVGASGYQFELFAENETPLQKNQVPGNQLVLKLPTAAKYLWRVTSLDERGEVGEASTQTFMFQLTGPAGTPPKLQIPASRFVRELSFEQNGPGKQCESVELRFEQRAKVSGPWLAVHSHTTSDLVPAVEFPARLPGGFYRIGTICVIKYRANSLPRWHRFEVVGGDRSPASENLANIRKILDRVDKWYFLGTYYLSQLAYEGKILEENKSSSLKALTGTLSLAIGKMWGEKVGMELAVDWGGITVGEKNTFIFGVDTRFLYKFSVARRDDVKLRLGAYFTQFPELRESVPEVRMDSLQSQGISFGTEYWYALSPAWAIQMNASGKSHLLGKSSRGNPIAPSLSYAAGPQLAWKLNKTSTALFGYSFRSENYLFKGSNESLNIQDNNRISVQGHFLHLTYEWDF